MQLDAQWSEAADAVDRRDRGHHRGRRPPRRPPSSTRRSRPSIRARRKKNYDTTLGEGFAKIYVPAFGADYVFTIIEGTDPDDLYVGPGHYADTQYPGQPGNFSVAGHRVSKGSPFNDLGLLASCDAIVIETQDDWFVYRVLPMADEIATWVVDPAGRTAPASSRRPGQYAQVSGRTIVDPSDYAVVLPGAGGGQHRGARRTPSG